MDSTTSTKSNYRPLHPFDSVYTIVFILLMYYILGSTIGEICYLYQNDETVKIEALFYQFIVAFFFFYQLSRMYYYLKNFEEIIIKKGNHHFLEILSDKFQSSEKTVRLVLALIIVLFSKYQSQMYFLSLTLIICFTLLIIWDFIVIAGLKSTTIDTNTESFKTAKSFFYINNEIYFLSIKFFERIFGLFASIAAFFYQTQDYSNGGTYLFSIFLVCVFLFPLVAFYGKWQIDELNKTNFGVELLDDFTRPFYLPVYKLFHNLNFIK